MNLLLRCTIKFSKFISNSKKIGNSIGVQDTGAKDV